MSVCPRRPMSNFSPNMWNFWRLSIQGRCYSMPRAITVASPKEISLAFRTTPKNITELKEVQPQDAACIIETDCNMDFDAPVGYKEPSSFASSEQSSTSSSMLTNLPKQSAYAAAEARSSACPSPTPSSMSGHSSAFGNDDAGYDDKKPR
mmetsp:Transcript_10954/g.20012  ORF Transcript_10954/g.20012 Transcript_10954/m.20012 type:complete len:150 (-) Transcript_10954:164-613(-)